MGGAERAASACHEAHRIAADEAGEAVVIGVVGGHDMVVERDRPWVEPAGGAGDRAARLVQQHKPPRLDGMDVEGEALQRIGLQRRRIGVRLMHTDQHELVGLADGLAAEGRELGVGDIEHVVVAKLLPVEPARHLLGLKIGLAGKGCGERRRIDHQDLSKAGERAGEPLAKGVRHLRLPGSDHGEGAGTRQARPLGAGQRIGEAAGERHRDRPQDGRVEIGERGEVGARQLEHDGVAECGDRGGAGSVGEEGDLAYGRAAADLGDAAAVHLDGEAAGRHDIESIGWVPLVDEDASPGHGKGDEAAFEIGELPSRQVAEGLHQRQRRPPRRPYLRRRFTFTHRSPRFRRLACRSIARKWYRP